MYQDNREDVQQINAFNNIMDYAKVGYMLSQNQSMRQNEGMNRLC